MASSEPSRTNRQTADAVVSAPETDRFEIRQCAGDAASSTVWQATDLKQDCVVAVKRIREDLARSRELMSRVKRDAKVLSKLQHPGIVSVHELTRDDSGPLLVLEWVKSRNLAVMLESSGPLKEQRAIKAIAAVADALHAAHQKKVTHRNIKPSNILFTADGTPRLTDFGLRRVDVESVLDAPGETDCIAPETVANPRDVSPQSDIWSLAAVLYQAVTGWSVRDFEASLLPDAVRDVLVCALADDPADRFSSAAAFVAALRGDRSELDSRELKPPQQFRPLKSQDQPSPDDTSPQTEEPPESGRSSILPRVRVGKATSGQESDVDGAAPESGATTGRVTKPRRPLKPEEQTSDDEASLQAQEPAESRRSSAWPRVRFGKPSSGHEPAADDETSEQNADAGRVTKPRRPLKHEEQPTVDDRAPLPEASAESARFSGLPRVRFGKPGSGNDPAADDATSAPNAGAGRATKPRRPLKHEEQPSGDDASAQPEPTTEPSGEDSAPQAAERTKSPRSSFLSRLRFGKSSDGDASEAGATEGRVTKPRRPLKPDEDVSADESPSRTPRAGEDQAPAEPRAHSDETVPEADVTTRTAPRQTRASQEDATPAAMVPARKPSANSELRTEDERTAEPDGEARPAARREPRPPDESGSLQQPGNDQTASHEPAEAADDHSTSDAPRRKRAKAQAGATPGKESRKTTAVSDEPVGGRSEKTKKTSQTLITGWGAAIALIVAVVVATNWPESSGIDTTTVPVVPGSGGESTTSPGESVGRQEQFAGTEIQIGPNGQFKSIAPCLEYLQRNAGRYPDNDRGLNVKLVVSSGKAYGPIVIDNTHGDLPNGIHIVADEAVRPVLTSDEGHVVDLRNVKSFRLEGFDIDAENSDVAIRIAGDVTGTRLVDLKVGGFQECGLQLDGTIAEVADELVVRSSRFSAGSEEATGIRISAQDDARPSRVQVLECRISGPATVGIALDGGAEFVEFRENILDQTDVGLRFTGESVNWIDVLVANTTFYECAQAGVTFEHLPVDTGIRGTQVTLHRNLFAKCGGPELQFESGAVPETHDELVSATGIASVSENWSDRGAWADATSGEVELVGVRSHRLETVQFHSTDRGKSNFLMLPKNSVMSSRGSARFGTRRWIGARPAVE